MSPFTTADGKNITIDGNVTVYSPFLNKDVTPMSYDVHGDIVYSYTNTKLNKTLVGVDNGSALFSSIDAYFTHIEASENASQ